MSLTSHSRQARGKVSSLARPNDLWEGLSRSVDEGSLPDVAQAMFGVDVVVAGKEISIVFDDRDISADGPEDAQRMLLPERRPGRFLENLHFDPADIPAHPFVEDGAEKVAPGFRRDGVRSSPRFGLSGCRSTSGRKVT